jgi:hypothetical protein
MMMVVIAVVHLHNVMLRLAASIPLNIRSVEYKRTTSGTKLYNDQCNAQVFNLFIYLLLPYMFGLKESPKHVGQK